jgi:succinate dehydrogenase/fumarate reductase cytochrome b subunit (b558 family)
MNNASYFLLRRLHSLLGIFPLGLFLFNHLLTNSTAMISAEFFEEKVKLIHMLGPLLPIVEAVLIFVPLSLHIALGIYIATQGKIEISGLPYRRNYAYAFQRWTGWIALVYIAYHVIHLRFMHDMHAEPFSLVLARMFNEGMWGIPGIAFHVDLFSARAGEALALGVRAGRHQRGGEHQGRGRLSPPSTRRDTLFGGDFLADQPPSRAWPTRRAGHRLHARPHGRPVQPHARGQPRFPPLRRHALPPHGLRGATTGQQLLYALDEQVRRARRRRRRVLPGEKMVRKFDWEFLSLVLDDNGALRGIVAQDLKDREDRGLPGDAVSSHGRPGHRVRAKHQLGDQHRGSAAARAYQQGATYANGEFIQVHPTAIPGADKLRLISESVRGEGGRVWVPKDRKDRATRRISPRPSATTSSSAAYPKYGNLVPRDIASREIFHVSSTAENAAQSRARRRLSRRHPSQSKQGRKPSREARRRPRDLREVRRRRPLQEPDEASSPRCTTRWAASGSTSSGRDGLAQGRSPRNHRPTSPALYAVGEVDYQYHGANRLGANSLLSCIYGGMGKSPRSGEHRSTSRRNPARSFHPSSKTT